MSVTVTPEAESRIRDLVESGHYPNAAAVIDKALDALEQTRLDRLRELVLAGFASGDGGEFTPETWAEIAREADEADRLGLPIRREVQP